MLDPDKYEIHVICNTTGYQFGIERIRQIQNTKMCKRWDYAIYVDSTEHVSPATAYVNAREAIKNLKQSKYLNKVEFEPGSFVNGQPEYVFRYETQKRSNYVENRDYPNIL